VAFDDGVHSNFDRTKTFIYPLYPKPPTKGYFIRGQGRKMRDPGNGVGAGTQETYVHMRSRMLHGTNNPLST